MRLNARPSPYDLSARVAWSEAFSGACETKPVFWLPIDGRNSLVLRYENALHLALYQGTASAAPDP